MLVSSDVQGRFCGFLMAKAWILEELTELFLLNPAAQQAIFLCACPVSSVCVCGRRRAQPPGCDCIDVLSDVSLAALKPNTTVTEITLRVWFGFAFKGSNLSSLCISGHINNCVLLCAPVCVSVCLGIYLIFYLQYISCVFVYLCINAICWSFTESSLKAALTSSPTEICQSPSCDLPTSFLHPQQGFS